MRIGKNPQIEKEFRLPDYFHQVIVPVYIPDHNGYFSDSFSVLKICIESLLRTSHDKTFISIVNNGSSPEVEAYLDGLYRAGKIQELIHTNNIGKLNAVNKAFVGQAFPLVTITDADVLFLNGWQKAVYDVYEAFPKAGAVCTTPNSRAWKELTANIFFDRFFSKSLRFAKVENPQAMVDFLDSIGNTWKFRPVHLEKYLTINNGNKAAVVGAGHYSCTYRRDALPEEGFGNHTALMGKKLMFALDVNVVKKGFWRLSTVGNFTYHLGNTTEPWMEEQLQFLRKDEIGLICPALKQNNANQAFSYFKIKVFGSLLLSRQFLWRNFFRYKGLNKEEAKQY